ncbi:GNAT family N-acetyltransferase [Lysobacter humi (ex Lee et al. 2017)]
MPKPIIELRDATASDFPALLALNAESVEVLSPLDAARLERLNAQSAYCRVACIDGVVAGFLLALREGANYDSENYRWFDARYEAFLYVDRIVVARSHQGLGIGRVLYDDLIADARRAALPRIACEYDLEPPNPASAHFHAGYGFREVATQVLARGKRVSLQVLDLG